MKKTDLQKIEDKYVKSGHYGERLRQALNSDKKYKKLLSKEEKTLPKKKKG